MKEYRCPKCNSKNLFVKKVRNNTGLYCGDCGAWIKWVGKNELRVFEYLNRQKHVDDANSKQDDIASIIYSTLDHMYCDNCRFNSAKLKKVIMVNGTVMNATENIMDGEFPCRKVIKLQKKF